MNTRKTLRELRAPHPDLPIDLDLRDARHRLIVNEVFGLPPEIPDRVTYTDTGVMLTDRGRIPDHVAARETGWASGHADVLEPILSRVCPRDAYLLRSTIACVRQVDMGAVLGVTQPSVVVDVRGACARARVVAQVLDVLGHEDDCDHLDAIMEQHDIDPIERLLTIAYIWTGSQSESGRLVGRSQGYARHRIWQTRRRMWDTSIEAALILLDDYSVPLTDPWRDPDARAWCERRAALLGVSS